MNPSYDVEAAIRVIGGKWKVLIIWHLIEETRRFGQLRRLIPNITEKMLIRQLVELESDGIIIRKDYQTVPPKVEYSLSEHGQSLLPILEVLCEWGKLHLDYEDEKNDV